MNLPRRASKFTAATAFFFIAIMISPNAAEALDFSASLGTWRFVGSNSTFAYAGLGIGAAGRLEAGAGVVPRIIEDRSTNEFSRLYSEIHIAYALYGDRARPSGIVGTYANILLELGYLFGLDKNAIDDFATGSVFLRLTPLALGNPYYGRRDRIAATTLFFAPGPKTWGIAFTLFQSDFFVARREEFR